MVEELYSRLPPQPARTEQQASATRARIISDRGLRMASLMVRPSDYKVGVATPARDLYTGASIVSACHADWPRRITPV